MISFCDAKNHLDKLGPVRFRQYNLFGHRGNGVSSALSHRARRQKCSFRDGRDAVHGAFRFYHPAAGSVDRSHRENQILFADIHGFMRRGNGIAFFYTFYQRTACRFYRCQHSLSRLPGFLQFPSACRGTSRKAGLCLGPGDRSRLPRSPFRTPYRAPD